MTPGSARSAPKGADASQRSTRVISLVEYELLDQFRTA